MFMNDISIVVRKMYVFAERGMADMHIGFPEQVILMYLKSSGPSPQDQIAEYFGLDKGSISKTLGKMEDKGLVTRKESPTDRRVKIVEYTPDAEDALERMGQVLSAWEEQVYRGISKEDAAVMESCIEIMARNANGLIDGGR